jgi:hypothetical protein
VDLANVSTGTWKILKFAKDPNKGNPQSVAVVISHKPQSSNVDSDLLTSLPRMRWL